MYAAAEAGVNKYPYMTFDADFQANKKSEQIKRRKNLAKFSSFASIHMKTIQFIQVEIQIKL